MSLLRPAILGKRALTTGGPTSGGQANSTVQITADLYGHLFPETNDRVIGRLDKALRAALPQPTDATTATIDNLDANAGVRPLRPGT